MSERGEDPGRYVYSALPDRPKLTWPHDKRIALWIVDNHEYYELLPPPPVASPFPKTARAHPDVLAYAWRDYGNRVGIWRVIEMLDRHGLKGSISLNVALCDHHPETAKACAERGWEFFSHGVYNTRYLYDLSEADERRVFEDVVETIERYSGTSPRGWLSPALTYTERTIDLLAEYGFTYTCDFFHDDQPFPMHVKSGRLISMPYSLELNDVIAYFDRITPAYYCRMIREALDNLYAEAVRNDTGYVMCIPLHPFVVAQPHHLRAFDETLGYLTAHEGVWFSTGAEIAQYYLDHHYDTVAAAVGH
jgi:peptidoglycan/xylan/chitin deacetylase (PgdA/CDA1 family)